MRSLCCGLFVVSQCWVVSVCQSVLGQEASQGDVPPAVQAALDQLRQEQQSQLEDLRRALEGQIAGLQAQLKKLTAALGGGEQVDGPVQFEVQRYGWQQGQGPIKMIHQDDGVCFLTRVGGGFQGGGEFVWIQLGEDGYYYLTGQSAQQGVHAEATCILLRRAPFAELAKPSDIDLAADAESPPPIEVDAQPADRRKLPGVYDGLAVGGGGRFLIFRFKALRKLAIFDTHEAKITKYVPLPSDDALVAAGRDKLLVVLPAKRMVQRYNLTSAKREVSRELSSEGTAIAVAMGSASDGPLFVQTAGEPGSGQVSLLDIENLQKRSLHIEGHGYSLGDAGNLWASANGSVLGLQRTGASPSGLTTLVVHGDKARSYYEHASVGHVIPSADGTNIFTAAGLYTPQGQKLARRWDLSAYSFPCAQPAYYLSLPRNERGLWAGTDNGERAPQLSIHTTKDHRRVLTLPPMDELRPSDDQSGLNELHSRVYFVPQIRRLITIPASRDALVIRDLKLVEALKNADVDYLFVDYVPLRTAKRGEAYYYQMVVQSPRMQEVSLALVNGPEGMQLLPHGALSWQVPKDFDQETVGVRVNVTDASRQQVVHDFEIKVD